jgi:N-hydroxyarylamine O-acetyltransferase
MNVQRYLDRIVVSQPSTANLDALAQLQLAHLLTVPFENLSVLRGEPIVLDEAQLVEKIVMRRRGGFCYELNSAFAWLLAQLGFPVTQISARVYNGTTGDYGPEFDHMALIVHLAQDYLVDVGFGDSARQPIPLPEGECEDVSGRYRVLPRNEAAGLYDLQRQSADGWEPQYTFTTQPRQLTEYTAMCQYHQSSPSSHFTQRLVCTRATPTGRITLSADSLTITERGEKRKLPVASPAEQALILQREFGIEQ